MDQKYADFYRSLPSNGPPGSSGGGWNRAWFSCNVSLLGLVESCVLEMIIPLFAHTKMHFGSARQFTYQFNKHGVYKNRASGNSRNNDRILHAVDFHQAVSDGLQAFPVSWRQLRQCTIPKFFLDLLVNCARTCERDDEVAQLKYYINGLIVELEGRGREEDIPFCSLLYILQAYIGRRVGQRLQDTQETAAMVRAGIEGLVGWTAGNARPLKTFSKIIDMPCFMLINFGFDDLIRMGSQGLGEAEIYGQDQRQQMMQTLFCNQQPPKGQKSQFARVLPDCLTWCIRKLQGPFKRVPPLDILTAGNHNDPTWKATVYVFCFLSECCFYDLQEGDCCPWARNVLKGFAIEASEFLITMTSMILTSFSESHAGDATAPANRVVLEDATTTSPTALLTFASAAAVALEQQHKTDLLDLFLDEYAYLNHPPLIPVTPEERRYMSEIFQYTREFINRFPLADDLGYEQGNPHASTVVDDATGYDAMN